MTAFNAPWWARNRHLQTLLPTWYKRNQQIPLEWEELTLSDGDFVDLAWHPTVQPPGEQQPLAIVFHGLEGSVHSPYAKCILPALAAQGWAVVLVHFRGCSGRSNRQWRSYHSGDSAFAGEVIDTLAERFSNSPLLLLGYSLGGNLLANYLADTPHSRVKGAALVSPPLDLAACSESIQRGFSRVYQHHLLSRMKRNLQRKIRQQQSAPLAPEQVAQWRNFWEFDQHYTAPAHGFAGADDYYQRCSGLGKLKHIAIPTLLLHSADDPFMDKRVIPQAHQLSAAVEYRLSDTGGHVGFVHGSLWRPRFWLEEAIPLWFSQQLQPANN
ncbi:hydrolase [Aliagarivorans taiwanensis]|uniref:hydrolase n=1 Tax=Aliagarivorans taiwanensis TaxID=561966 RepID=UPI0003FB9899|nr:hydrolase [Aliagarivorans taiwanensis]